LFRDGSREWRLFRTRVQGRNGLNQSNPRLLRGRGIMPHATRYDEELAGAHRYRSAICIRPANRKHPTEHQEHLVLVLMGVPGKLTKHLRHFDVLVVDLPDDSRRPKLVQSGARQFQRDWILLGLLLFELRIRSHPSHELVAVTGADGNLVTALGAATAQNSSTRLCLHAAQKAMGLRTVAAVGLKGTLRHDKKLLRQENAPAQCFSYSSNL